jgi:transcription elongation factor Elf1
MISVRNDAVTIVCGQCGAGFTAVGRRRWCSDACRQSAWRRRRAAPRPTQPAKIDTVYECPHCETPISGLATLR